jgi:hypothetical protein
MASDPGNSDDKPGKGNPDAPKPAGSPAPSSARGPFLIVTPSIGQVLASQAPPPQPPPSETPPGQTPPTKVQPARPASANKPKPPEPVAPSPVEPALAPGKREEPVLGEAPTDEPTYDEPTHHEPPRLVDTPQAAAAPPPKKPVTRPSAPSLAARSADRLAELNGPPPRRRGGCLFPLLILLILAGGGYFLWRAGKLDPLLSWAEPYTAPIVEKVKPIVARIEALIPGHQEEASPAPTSDDAMIIETKQLLQKLDFNPGPIDGTLDPATVAAIQAYQEAAGENVDGQPSQALLDELRSVANPPSN